MGKKPILVDSSTFLTLCCCFWPSLMLEEKVFFSQTRHLFISSLKTHRPDRVSTIWALSVLVKGRKEERGPGRECPWCGLCFQRVVPFDFSFFIFTGNLHFFILLLQQQQNIWKEVEVKSIIMKIILFSGVPCRSAYQRWAEKWWWEGFGSRHHRPKLGLTPESRPRYRSWGSCKPH